MELDAHIKILKTADDGPAVLRFRRVGEVAGEPVVDPVFKGDRLVDGEHPGEEDLSPEDAGADAMQLAGQALATLAHLESCHVGVAEERDAVQIRSEGLDHLHGPDAIDTAVRSDINVVMERHCLMPSSAERVIYVLFGMNRHGMTSRQDVNP